ncbi:MAG: flagellar motor switch protein FliN [Candidatus Accumulibacter sp.]|jgi:flagellar motor switch protein FliN/FliY|nr:flagellar motor switch protein FliN [Accumulibacter sp.]
MPDTTENTSPPDSEKTETAAAEEKAAAATEFPAEPPREESPMEPPREEFQIEPPQEGFPVEPPRAAPAGEPKDDASNKSPRTANIFPKFDPPADKTLIMNELDLILEIPVQVAVELGRVKITIKNLLQLAHGSVIELDTLAGDPLSVYVNGTLLAQGEVVVVNDKFGIRLTDIITPSERMKRVGH